MSSITNLSASQLRQAAELKDQIQSLENQLNQLLGSSTKSAVVSAPTAKAPKAKRGMSAAGKARIAAGQKARWAKVNAAKAAGAPLPAKVVKPGPTTKAVKPAVKTKRKISAAGIARIKAAQKARWDKVKAAKSGAVAVKPVAAAKVKTDSAQKKVAKKK